KSVTASDTLTLAATAKQTVTNTLTLNGAANNRLSLRSSQTGTQWKIDPQGTRTVSYLNVKDSNNTNASVLACTTGCIDSGNNTNWSIGATSITGTVYSDTGGTVPLSNVSIGLSVNNGTAVFDTSDPSGVFGFPSVTMTGGSILTM